jgi:hypothetical protein
MSYWMRFISTSGIIDARQVAEALRQQNPEFGWQGDASAGVLSFASVPVAQLQVTAPPQGLFGEEIAELRAEVEDLDDEIPEVGEVLVMLRDAQSVLGAALIWGQDEAKITLSRLDPAWAWLFDHHQGLLQADDEGYYDADGLVLDVS